MGNNKMTVQQAGSQGGRARAHKYSHEQLSEQAKRSAHTIEKNRPGFHAEIGQKGGSARGSHKRNQNEHDL